MIPATATRVPKRESIETTAPFLCLALESVGKTVGHGGSVRLVNELHTTAVVVVGRNLTMSMTRKRAMMMKKTNRLLSFVAASVTGIRVKIRTFMSLGTDGKILAILGWKFVVGMIPTN